MWDLTCGIWNLVPSPRIEPGLSALGAQTLNDWTTRKSLAAAAKSLQSCPTLCCPIDSSPPGSSNRGILQARILSGVPFPSPRKSFTSSLMLQSSNIPPASTLAILQTILHTAASDLQRIRSTDDPAPNPPVVLLLLLFEPCSAWNLNSYRGQWSSAYLSEPSAGIAYFTPLKPLGPPCCSLNISNSFPPEDLCSLLP